MVMPGMHAGLSCLLASHPAFDFHACVCVRRSVFMFEFLLEFLAPGGHALEDKSPWWSENRLDVGGLLLTRNRLPSVPLKMPCSIAASAIIKGERVYYSKEPSVP